MEAAIKSRSVDPARVYIAGRGDASAAVFYAIRGAGFVGRRRRAGRFAQGTLIPTASRGEFQQRRYCGYPVANSDDSKPVVEAHCRQTYLEWQPASGGGNAVAVIEWLAAHAPGVLLSIDCETNSPTFALHWIQPTKFDGNERNDVLASTAFPAVMAQLDLGGFGFRKDDPDPACW